MLEVRFVRILGQGQEHVPQMRRCLERAVRAERQAPEVVPKAPVGQREALVTDDRPRGRKRRLRAAGEGGERGGGTMARRARALGPGVACSAPARAPLLGFEGKVSGVWGVGLRFSQALCCCGVEGLRV